MPFNPAIQYGTDMLAERVIRKRNFRWWSKFNYITSAAVDSGTIISVLLIFLSLQINGQSQLNWWGNQWFSNSTFGPCFCCLWGGKHAC